MLGSKCRETRRLSNPRAPRNRNHDGGLFLTFSWRFNRVAITGGDGGEDVQKVDGKHGVEEYLAVGLGHTMAFQPAMVPRCL